MCTTDSIQFLDAAWVQLLAAESTYFNHAFRPAAAAALNDGEPFNVSIPFSEEATLITLTHMRAGTVSIGYDFLEEVLKEAEFLGDFTLMADIVADIETMNVESVVSLILQLGQYEVVPVWVNPALVRAVGAFALGRDNHEVLISLINQLPIEVAN